MNTDLERSVTTRVTVRGARVSSSATIERVTAASLDAVASFKTPNAVRRSQSSVKGADGFHIELPKHSVSVITLGLQ